MMKILVSDPITESGMAVLNEAKFEVVNLPKGTPEEKADACKDVHGWIIRSGTKITEDMIASAEISKPLAAPVWEWIILISPLPPAEGLWS